MGEKWSDRPLNLYERMLLDRLASGAYRPRPRRIEDGLVRQRREHEERLRAFGLNGHD